MRISLVGPVYPYRGGIAHHTTLLARHLAQRHQVQVISLKRQYPRWLVHGRDDQDPSQSALRIDAEYLLDPLNPVTWLRVVRRIRAWQSDLMILPWWVSYWAPSWLALAHLVHRRPRVGVLFLCHNVVPHESVGLDRRLAHLVLSQGDALLAQSREQAQMLQGWFPERTVSWTPHPSYSELGCVGGEELPSRAEALDNLGLCAHYDKAVLLFFGFVRAYKGLQVLLDALPLVLQHHPVHLLVAGEFWDGKHNYQAQIDRLAIAGHVTLVDKYVPNEELATYFCAADVVVLPYLKATQSGVVQLAFGFGVPVIATNVGGLPDAVTDGRTGLLLQPGDPEALARAVSRFLSDELGPRFSHNIRAQDHRFGWDGMVREIEDLALQAAECGER